MSRSAPARPEPPRAEAARLPISPGSQRLYQLTLANSQAAALAKLEMRHDLVVCDVNGETLELLDAVRRSDGLASRVDPNMPLIVLTARADELARVRYLDRGGDDVVAKPFSYPSCALASGRFYVAATVATADR